MTNKLENLTEKQMWKTVWDNMLEKRMDNLIGKLPTDNLTETSQKVENKTPYNTVYPGTLRDYAIQCKQEE